MEGHVSVRKTKMFFPRGELEANDQKMTVQFLKKKKHLFFLTINLCGAVLLY